MHSIQPTPYQHAVLTVPEHFNLLLAGGRGGAKTWGALLVVLRHVERYGPQARPLIVRETHKALLEIEETLESLLAVAYPGGVQRNRADHIFRLPSGAVIECGQLDGAQALKKYVGRSFTLLVVDEFGAMREHRHVDQLRASLRAPAGIPLRVIATANPGGTQHTYLHQTYISAAPAWEPFQVDGETWVQCPSTYLDNPHLDHADYERKIRAACGGDEELARAWLSGDWNIARGAFFAGVIDERVHQLPVAWPHPVTRAWAPFLAMDWGSSSPSVTFVCLRAPGDVGGLPKDSLVLLDELATADRTDPNVGLGWPPSKLAEAIKEMCGRWGVHPHGCGDDAAGLQDTLLSVLREHGVSLTRPRKERVAGWAKMRELLHNAKERNGKPGLFATARCGYFWKTVPFLERDPHRPEDIVTAGPDHAADAARYACLYAHTHRPIGNGRTVGTY